MFDEVEYHIKQSACYFYGHEFIYSNSNCRKVEVINNWSHRKIEKLLSFYWKIGVKYKQICVKKYRYKYLEIHRKIWIMRYKEKILFK